MNSYLATINTAIHARDMKLIQSTADELKLRLADGGEEPSWGWNGLITKKLFNLILSPCPHCEARVGIESKGIFGYEARCSACYDVNVPGRDVVGIGNEIEDTIEDWLRKTFTTV